MTDFIFLVFLLTKAQSSSVILVLMQNYLDLYKAKK